MQETSDGLPRSDPGPRVTPGKAQTPTSQLQAGSPLCSTLHTAHPRGLTQAPVTADTAPMDAALMATHHLLGHSGKAVPWLGPCVFRAGGLGQLFFLSRREKKGGTGQCWAGPASLLRAGLPSLKFLRYPDCNILGGCVWVSFLLMGF